MPAPASYEYSVDALVDAQEGFLALVDAGSGAGKLKIYSDADELLCTITLSDPAGAVNSGTGQLTITAPSSATGVAADDATYGTVTDSDDAVHLTAPVVEAPSASPGNIALSETAITIGSEIELISFTVG